MRNKFIKKIRGKLFKKRDEKDSTSLSSKGKAKTKPRTKWDPSEFLVSPAEGKTRFHDLDLPMEIMHGIYDLGFEYCTPDQAATLPKALAGVDVAGKAQTGTGKTAAFVLPILNRLRQNPQGCIRALIISPTRELAEQIR